MNPTPQSPLAPLVSAPAQDVTAFSYRRPFAIMTVLFFMWGFMTVWNDILIPRFREVFTLSYFEATLVQFAFFGAYGIGSLIYYLISMVAGDPVNRIGHKNGVVFGVLVLAVVGGLFFSCPVPDSYTPFPAPLFSCDLGLPV